MTDIDNVEMAAQRDPRVRAQRLARFKAQTADKVWCRVENGEWILSAGVKTPTEPVDLSCYEL